MISRAYPVVNGRLGQNSQMIATRDFNLFFSTALDEINQVAAIARSHGLSDDEENQVRRAVGTLEQYTVPMSACPAPAPVAATPSCPVFPGAPATAPGIPWWAAAIAGLGLGAAAAGLLA